MSNSQIGKILVVDDEVELKNILVEALASQGFMASGFTSGEAALEVLREEAFDVLLTDLMMPAMNGLTLLKESLEIDPHLVAIMMTGQGTIQTAVDAMKVGAFDYVLKPFRIQTVMPVLTRAMNERHMRLENLHLRETVAIYELAQTIAFTLDSKTLLSKLADAALQQTDADEVSILLPASDGDLYVAVVRGENRERLLGERVTLDESISGWVARERQPLMLTGEVNDTRFRSMCPHPEIRSAISIPMQVGNKLVGTININSLNRARPFTLGQMKALTILAGTASGALESASLYTQVKEAEKNYRSIFENATEALFQTSKEGRLITANPEFARILGYDSPAEAIETITDASLHLYVNPEDRLEAARQQTEGQVLVGFEMQARRKNGENIWVSVNRRAVFSEAGEVLFFEGSFVDITQRKRAEQERARLNSEIENHRLRLNNMVASVPGVVWEAWGEPDAAIQRIDFVSDYVESMLGYSVEEWLSIPNFWLTIVHPSDREETGRLVAEAYQRGQSCRLEFRWLTKEGREVWVESNFVVVLDEVGKSVGMRGVNTDISERKRAEEALKQSESQLAEAQRQAHIGSWNLDLETNVLTWSAEHYRIFGVEPGDIDVSLGDEVFDLIHPEDVEEVRRQVAGTIETREPFNFNYRVLWRNGEERIVQSSGMLTSDEAGKPIRLFGTAQDITEREHAERLQAELNAEIKEQRERLDTIVGSVPGIVFESWSDPSAGENRTDFVSDYINTMLGYSVSEWLATPGFWLKAVHPDDRERVKREAGSQFRSRSKGEFEFRWLGKDKRIVWVRAHTIILRDDLGKSIGVRGVVTDITAGKLAEKALRESEERYRELVENADDLIYEHDLKGSYTASNKAGERITGYTLEESLKLNLMDTVAPEYLDRAKDMLRRKLTGEKVTAYELVILTKDGRRVPVEVNTRLVLKDGVPIGVQGIARDITERKRVDEIQARRETHALFRADISAALAVSRASLRDTLVSCAQTMVQHLDAAFARIWTLNHDKQLLELQASAGLYTHITGPHASVPVGSFKIGKIAFERAPHITNEVQNDERVSDKAWARAQGMVAFAGYPLAVDDRVVGVMAMFSKHQLADDTLDALASVADLISQAIERKRAEEALGESEERYRLLFESNPQPMWVYDLETLAFLAINQSAVTHYGYSQNEFLSMTIKDIRPPEDVSALFVAIDVTSEGVGKAGVWRHLRKDGSLIEVEITSHLLIFDGRQAELILANDISERLRLESALMASEAQLRQSQKLEAIGQLAGGVAHDFNNLLTVIGGYSSILLNKLAPDSPHRSNVEEIKKAGDRAGALTRQLLAFSRKQILQPKILDLNVVVADLEKMVRRLIGEDINLLAVTTPTLGKVKADPGQIEQVLLNLIVNARDAMPQGGKLTVQTSNVTLSKEHSQRHEIEPGRYVMLAVSDNGCGMDADLQDRIFDPFFTTKASGKGTGLGLATVYGIVKQSGGNIWVYSEPGKGSTFKIYLPRVDQIAEEEAESILQPAPQGTETVLMVEDEDQVRNILQQILEEQGYRVLAAANGLEALSYSEDPECDIRLVITDVVMPNMSGRELAERLLEVRPNLPVLFMSGYTDDAIVHHGLLDEKINFIQKPFDPAGVARKVREVLDSSTYSRLITK